MLNLLDAITEGIVLGITLAILTGPAFFALLQTSIRNGYRSGIAFAVGIFISDTILVLLSCFGVLKLFNNPSNNLIMGIMGGTILIMFGVFNIFQKHPLEMEDGKTEMGKILFPTTTLPVIALKGFAINIINPFVIIFWIGVVSVESARYQFSQIDMISLFSATLLTVFATDILKALAAQKITSFLSPNVLLWINRIAGVILIVCGVTLIWKVSNTFI